MRHFGKLIIASFVFASACGPQKKHSLQDTISEAGVAGKGAFQLVKERSSGIIGLGKSPNIKLEKIKIEASGPVPSSTLKPYASLKPQDRKRIEDLVNRFRSKASVSSYIPTCNSFGDPSPADQKLLTADFYTKQTTGIIQVANELGTAQKIFEFVKNEIQNEQNFGATQSAEVLLRTRKGSVVDKANLLAALLRAQGTPVQFERGEIYLTETQAQRFFNEPYLGNVVFIINQVFGRYFSNATDFNSSFYHIVDGIKYFVIPHVWLRVWNSGSWVSMDPTLVSDQLLPNRGSGLLVSSYEADLSKWFLGPDDSGNYIKPKTLIDFLYEGTNFNSSPNIIASTDSKSEVPYTNGVVSSLAPCQKDIFSGIENGPLEFRGEVIVKNSTGDEVMKINQPLARFSEQKSYLSHSAGLLSEFTSPQSGNLEFKFDDQVVAQYPAIAQSANVFDIIYTTYNPFGYSVASVSSVANEKYTAGGVLATHFFAREVSQSDLELATDELKKDVENIASPKILMVDSHRLIGLLTHFYHSKVLRDLYTLRGMRWLPNSAFVSLTTAGRIIDVGDLRDFGFIPSYPIVDVGQYGIPIAVADGAFGTSNSYYQEQKAIVEALITSSDYEAKVFEDLYGLKSYSTTRALQIAGLSDANNHSTYTYSFFKGIEINADGITQINSLIDHSSELYSKWAAVQSMANPGLTLWSSNKNIIDPESGDELAAWFLYGGSKADAGNVMGARFSVIHWGTVSVEKFIHDGEFNLIDKIFRKNKSKNKKFGQSDECGINGGGIHVLGGWGRCPGDTNGNAVYDEGDDGESVDADEGEDTEIGSQDTPLDGIDDEINGELGDLADELGKNGGSCPASASKNPVQYSTGLMWHTLTDFNLIGHTPSTGILFQRTYYTFPQYQAAGGWEDVGDLGKGWMHVYDTRLLDGGKDANGHLLMGALPNSNSDILWITETANTILFKYDSATGLFSPPAGVNLKLEISGSNYVLTRKGNIKFFFKKDYSSNFNGRLTKISEPHGEELTLNYDSNGRLASVHSPFAGNLLFTRDSQNKLTNIRNDKNNLSVNFGYSNGLLSYSDDFDGNRTNYEYNSSQTGTAAFGLLTSIIDPLGRRIGFEYFRSGKVYKEFSPGGAKQIYQYAPYRYQKYTRVDAPNGETTEYRYDDAFRVILEIRPDGSRIQRKWNSDSQVEWQTDGLGNKTQFTYDSRGNTTGVKRPLDFKYISANYDQTFDVPVTIVPLVGSPIQSKLNEVGDVTSQSRTIGTKNYATKFTYDQFGSKLSTASNLNSYSDVTDADGLLKFKFDIRNPQNIKHDSQGRIIEVTFSNGRVLNFSYDKFSRIISSDDNNGPSFRNSYDTVGRLTKRQRLSGGSIQTATFSYDDRDRLTSEKNYAGETTSYSYDIVGAGCRIQDKVTQIVRDDGATKSFRYDSMGRKIKEILPDGTLVQYGYNLRGDLVSVLDSQGNLTQNQFDENQRLVKTLSQSAGFLKSLDGGNDRLGLLPQLVTYAYDSAGRLVKKEVYLNDEAALNGKYVTEYIFDALDRMVQQTITHQRGGKVVETFDQINFKYYPILSPTLVSEITNTNVKLSFNYETQPPFNLTSYSQEPTTTGVSLGIERHQYKITPVQSGPLGKLSRDGIVVLNQNYDISGRLIAIQGSFAGLSNTAAISYDGFGRRASILNSVGSNETFGYDDNDRITNISWSGSPSISEAITYNRGGLISKIVREIGAFNYGYTARDEVSSVSYSGSEVLSNSNVNTNLNYDSAGNITSYRGQTFQSIGNFTSQVDGTQYVPSSDGLGRLKSRTLASSIQSFNYFPEGQLKQIREASLSGGYVRTINYYYDGLGRRIAKVFSGTAPSGTVQNFKVSYSHLGSENKILFSKLAQAGAASKETLFVDSDGIDDHLFEISTSSGVKTYKKDHVGSIINSQAIGQKSVYGLFGENLGTPVSTDSISEPLIYGFTGREYDSESGLYYFRARYYDSQLGKFLSKDLVGPDSGGDANSYRYVRNNPVIFVDPSGLRTDSFGVSFSGAGFGFGGSATFSYNLDDSGGSSLTFTGGVGSNTGGSAEGMGFSLAGSYTSTNADSVNTLNGWGGEQFLGVYDYVGGGVGAVGGKGYEGYTEQVGGGAGVMVNTMPTYTIPLYSTPPVAPPTAGSCPIN